MGEYRGEEEFYKAMKRFEEESYNSISERLDRIRNIIVKKLIESVATDSLKHATFYEGLITLTTRVQPALTDEDYEELKGLIEKHIRLEEEMIKRIEEFMPRVKDEKVKYVLDYILVDEKRHHAIFKALLELIVKRETITEEEWWDYIWKESPWHGSPGG